MPAVQNLENAIKHGFRFTDPNKRGFISIRFTERGNLLECSVTDNGIGRQRSEALNRNSMETYHKSTALLVTQERLDLLRHMPGVDVLEITGLTDQHGEAAGTQVVLRVPI